MPKYIMANKRAGLFTSAAKTASRTAVDTTFATIRNNVDVIHDHQPGDLQLRRVVVFNAEAAEIQALRQNLPQDVLLEPEIVHWPTASFLVPPLDLIGIRRQAVAAPFRVGMGLQLTVNILGGGQPLASAEVILVLQGFGGFRQTLAGRTGADGVLSFQYGWFFQPAALIVVPAGNFWSMLVRGPKDPVTVDCPPLPADGPLAWWHEVMGENVYDADAGKGIGVGVADTGVGPHSCLAHVHAIGAFIDGHYDPAGGQDVDSHGSHVCGIIGARPQTPGQYAGLAPGADLHCARVFPPGQGANQGDIARAIDELSKTQGVDLLNMSLGAPQGSQIEHDAIIDAFERGTLCVCAAGNDGNGHPVNYPAAFPETLAVSALGLLGWAPEGTSAANRVPKEADKFGDEGLYLADFSCTGPDLDCGAPGVGILSTVPERYGLTSPYGVMDGTSMASPAACGALAALLAQHANYQGLPRDKTRAEMARKILHDHCRNIGLKAEYVGRGIAMTL
jgi:subtilisin